MQAMGNTDVWRRDATRLGPNRGPGYSLVFLDPPYHKALGEAALASAVAGNGWHPARSSSGRGHPARPPHRLRTAGPAPLRRYSCHHPAGAGMTALASRPEAVLFDCDGVIVDSEGPTFHLLLKDLAAHGLPLTLHQLETDYIGGTIETVATRARAAGARLPDGWEDDVYTRIYALLAEGTPLMPGILAVFDTLDAAGIPYAVGSNGTPQKMQITLGQHGLIPRFRTVLSGQAIGRPKPAPDLYLLAALHCGANLRLAWSSKTAPPRRSSAGSPHPCLGFAPQGPDTPPAGHWRLWVCRCSTT